MNPNLIFDVRRIKIIKKAGAELGKPKANLEVINEV